MTISQNINDIKSFQALEVALSRAELKLQYGGRRVKLANGKSIRMNDLMKIIIKLNKSSSRDLAEKKAAIAVLKRINIWDSKQMMAQFESTLNKVQKKILHLHQSIGNGIAKCFGLNRREVAESLLADYTAQIHQVEGKAKKHIKSALKKPVNKPHPRKNVRFKNTSSVTTHNKSNPVKTAPITQGKMTDQTPFAEHDNDYTGYSAKEIETLIIYQNCCAFPKLGLYLDKNHKSKLPSGVQTPRIINDAYVKLNSPKVLTPDAVLKYLRSLKH